MSGSLMLRSIGVVLVGAIIVSCSGGSGGQWTPGEDYWTEVWVAVGVVADAQIHPPKKSFGHQTWKEVVDIDYERMVHETPGVALEDRLFLVAKSFDLRSRPKPRFEIGTRVLVTRWKSGWYEVESMTRDKRRSYGKPTSGWYPIGYRPDRRPR